MNNEMNINMLSKVLEQSCTTTGIPLQAEIIDGDVAVLQVLVQDREEFPVYLTIDDCQILCVTHLWKESEIQKNKREELLESLLILNIPVPLSSFSKVGNQYIIFGALSTHASIDDVLHEIETLSDNTLDAVSVMAEYLQ